MFSGTSITIYRKYEIEFDEHKLVLFVIKHLVIELIEFKNRVIGKNKCIN